MNFHKQSRAVMQYLQRIRQSIKQALINFKLTRKETTPSSTVKLIKPDDLPPQVVELRTDTQSYFVEARSWVDDLYTSAIISRNRYKLAFLVSMGLAIMLTIAISGLIPLQHMEPLLINHYPDGRVSVVPIAQPYAPTSQAPVESDIVRYVVNRESYDASSYDTQYSLINLLSDNNVAQQYINEQSSSNKSAPINQLGDKGFRTVHIDSVVFLDSTLKNNGESSTKRTHYNLAQVNFTITGHATNSSNKHTTALTALVAWCYQGTPSSPSDRWRNWDGFTITRYTVEQRNV